VTFRPELFGGCEAAKIAPIIVPYLQGKALDIGSGPGSVWPTVTGIDTGTDRGRPITNILGDGTNLSGFTDGSYDSVFSSFLLHQIERSKVPVVLEEWSRVLKVGGYLVLYLPNSFLVPMEGEEFADPFQKWQVNRGDIETLLQDTSCGWELVESEERSEDDEYGLLVVARKLADKEWRENLWQRNPEGKKRALIIRYGAIGDVFVMASILPGLKEQRYHITINCKPATKDVLEHDPHIDEWLIQADDFVPNETLGPYWKGLEQRYDRIINLSESVEGLLLALPGRLNHGYPEEARRLVMGRTNYLEHTCNIAAVPHEFSNSRFHATEAEMKLAEVTRRQMDGPVIVWVVNGSSAHKVYPWVHIVGTWLLERTPCHLVLYGDPGVGKQLQEGIMSCLKPRGADMRRVHGIAGVWPIRRSLSFLKVVDCIVGPETGPMNAAAMESVPKVIYLSHSSHENLTKHWINTTVLTPDMERAPCYPCHRLHHTWEFCHKDNETGAAKCASGVAPSVVFEAIALNIGAKKAA
jgi:ADP-heptose:LPS heptosyltransferase